MKRAKNIRTGIVAVSHSPGEGTLGSWPWFIRRFPASKQAKMTSSPVSTLLCGGFRLAASRSGGTDDVH